MNVLPPAQPVIANLPLPSSLGHPHHSSFHYPLAAFQSPFSTIPADPDTTTSGTSSESNQLDDNAILHPCGTIGPPQQLAMPKPPPSGAAITIELANKGLWEKFHNAGNEMVVTRPGRKMFPKLELHLSGLDPKKQYTLFMFMEKLDNFRYKYQAGGWSAAGQDDNGNPRSNHVQHHEGWNKGEFWGSQQGIGFERVKLTNKEIQQGGGNSLLSLSSMQKYQPVIVLCQFTAKGAFSSVVKEFRPVQCQFIAVTAYQSEAVTKLKVAHNPFAKGFREGSSRKRTLSPSPDADDLLTKRPLLLSPPSSSTAAAMLRHHHVAPSFPSPSSAFPQFPPQFYSPTAHFLHQSPPSSSSSSSTITSPCWLPTSASTTAQFAAVAMMAAKQLTSAAATAGSMAIPAVAAPGMDVLSLYLYQQMFGGGNGREQHPLKEQ